MNSARDEIMRRVGAALQTTSRTPVAPLPATGRVPSRTPGDVESELTCLLTLVQDLGGKTRRVKNRREFEIGLADLISTEQIRKAALWETDEMKAVAVGELLISLGIQIISVSDGSADKQAIASCDLGVTGGDAALPESGTLALVTTHDQPAMTSLLPRVHLAIVRPSALVPDLSELFSKVKNQKHLTLISGPSRTTDIEKVLTLGVHGPKSLHVWCCD